MPNFRRWRVEGGLYFFTVVTQDRQPILTSEASRTILREAILEEKRRRSFRITAMVLLPDHLHTVWILPAEDSDYSTRWQQIKGAFTERHLTHGGNEATRSWSRESHGERGVWQKRFWEHTVRDEDDLKRCLDYIHWNPVKHGLVSRPSDYPWSSFHRHVLSGEYEPDWGTGSVAPIDIPGAEWE